MSTIQTTNLKHESSGSNNIVLDSSGNVSLANNLTVDTNTLFVDAANNRIGVKTASPTRPLTVAAASGESVNILGVFDARSADSGTVGNCVIAFSDPTSTAGQFSTRLGSVGDSLAFYTNGSNERMRILSGGGITFNGDTAAANALDDYEEGTWTPTVTAGTGSYTTIGVRGEYTKIGNQVTLWGEVVVTSVGTASSYMQITGLPFNVIANDRAVGVTRNRGTQNYPMGSVYSPQNDRLVLVKYDGTTPWANSSYWMFSVSYQV